MASNAAMLLDPRAYKKQLQHKNGNEQEHPPALPPTQLHVEPSFDSSFTSTPPEDPSSDSDTISSLVEGAGQEIPAQQARNSTSTAHRPLSPQNSRLVPKPSPGSRTLPRSGASSSRNSAASSPQQVPASMPDVDVEFTSTGRSEDSGDGKRSSQLLDDEEDSNHGSLILDMYGVERRKQLHKKMKIDKDEQTTGKKNLDGIGNTDLGKWMKADQSSADSPLPTPDVVDLTLEAAAAANDSDDLQVTGSNDLSVQRVCYGKLENAMVQAHTIPKPSSQAFGGSAHDWPSIKLGVHREPSQGNNRIDVSDPHGKIFGAVEPRTAAIVVPLLDSPVLKLDITARLDVRKRAPHEFPWDPCSASYRASINLYGLRKDAERVGKYLGQNNLWLGTPFSVDKGVVVFNPHAERRRANAASFLPSIAARGRPGLNYEVRTAEEVNDAVMKMFDQLQSAENIPEMDPPPLFLTPLLRHQKQALWFMTEKEKPRRFGPKEKDNNSLWRVQHRPNGAKQYREIISGTLLDEEPPQVLGGLLADVMGLGKTLSILSLIVSTLSEAHEWPEMMPPPDLVRDLPGIRNTKTTLLVSPLSAVNNWVLQVKEHLKENAISFYVFHGAARTTDVDELSKYDLVITTYSIVLSELSGRGSKRGTSPLMKMNMFRIVLDEAHTIREQSAAQTQAIFKLNAQRKWSVTGTPIQNRLEDLLSVTKFLGLFPYDDRGRFNMHILSRFKTGDTSVLASLRVLVDSFTLRRVKDKIDLPEKHDQIVTLDFSEKESELHEFFRKESNVMMRVIAGEDQSKMKGRMYHHILKAMMILRQISAHGKEILDSEERQRIKGMSVHDAIDLEEGGSDKSGVTDKKSYEMFTLMQASAADLCAVCGKRLEDSSDTGTSDPKTPIAIVLPCFDVLCPDCFSGWKSLFDTQSGAASSTRCQVCDGWISVLYTEITIGGLEEFEMEQASAKHSKKQAKVLGEYEGPHTKTIALIRKLQETASESKLLEDAGERPLKSVVFSAWTSHLDLIEIALKDNGMAGCYARLDGTMTLAARGKALQELHSNDHITILLATIGAGGVGLNLNAASKVYIMEPQYNPAAVAQAVDRVHRLGQTRTVTTVQFIMRNSIEEKIFELAKKKQQIADLSMNRGKLDKKEVQEKRMMEYRSLFK